MEEIENRLLRIPNRIENAIQLVNSSKRDRINPNLIENYIISFNDVFKGDISNVFTVLKYAKSMRFLDSSFKEEILEYIRNHPEECKDISVSESFFELVNLRNLGKVPERSDNSSCLHIDIEKLAQVDLSLIEQGENIISLECKSLSEISLDKLRELKKYEDRIDNFSFYDQEGAPQYCNASNINGEYEKLMAILDIRKEIRLSCTFPSQELRKFLEEHEEYLDKFLFSDDGRTLLNIEKIGEQEILQSEVSINLRDLSRINLQDLQNGNNKVRLVIGNVAELSIAQIEELSNNGIELDSISISSKDNDGFQNDPYDIDTYKQIRQKMEELVEGIDLELPEKERFAEVYRRVCSSIVYDEAIVDPKTEEEVEWKENNRRDSRNLKNGLLLGKCVCAGYADILRNALSMVGIESEYVGGAVFEKKIKLADFDESQYGTNKEIIRDEENGVVTIGGRHAWNKVKLDGQWYNVDPTWDANDIRQGITPTSCLKTDAEIIKNDKKMSFAGPECNTRMKQGEIAKLFGDNSIYIGNIKIISPSEIGKKVVQGFEAVRKQARKISDRINETLFPDGTQKLLNEAKLNEKVMNVEKKNSWNLRNWNENPDIVPMPAANKTQFSDINKNNEAEKDDNDREI